MKNDPSNLQIKFTSQFDKMRRKAPLPIKVAFREVLELFLEDQNNPQLRNHPLKEEYSGYRSIDITVDWRALFKEHQTKSHTIVTFHIMGTHKQLYG